MAMKKKRAFFVCPRWKELVDLSGSVPPAADRRTLSLRKIDAAILDGQPVARSTLRKALVNLQQTSGSIFDLDAYMVDRRRP